MIAETRGIRQAAQAGAASQRSAKVGLEEYYSEAGPDYAAWSGEFNMHFGYYRVGMNPLRREGMLEQMNVEVLKRLRVDAMAEPKLLDLGCGLGATLRSFARRLPQARLLGLTRVPWQVERASALNAAAGCGERVRVIEGDYEDTILPRGGYDGYMRLRAAAMRMERTRGRCWRRRTDCCGQEGVWWWLMDFCGRGGLVTGRSRRFFASCASVG